MNNIIGAYVTFFVYIIVDFFVGLVVSKNGLDFLFMILLIFIYLVVASKFISKDAISKGLSKRHGFWALLGIIGILIYHIGFSKNK